MPSARSNDDKIKAIKQTICVLEKLNSAEADQELFFQRRFLTHLETTPDPIQPMSQETKDKLKSLLTKLNRLVRADREFVEILALAQKVKKLIEKNV